MRILHISKKIPHPPKDGESIANSNLARSFQSLGIQIDLATLNTNKHYTSHEIAKENLDFYSELHIVDHELKLNPASALKNLLTDTSYNIERFKSGPFTQRLEDILAKNRYDCIVLETIYVLPYLEIIRKLSAAIVILRAHNVEHHIWENKAEKETNFAKAYYLNQLSKHLGEYQEKYIPRCDGIITVSSVDYDWFSNIVPKSKLLLSPIGINYQSYQSYTQNDSSFNFGFIGAMDWLPNSSGIKWYIENVWSQFILSNKNNQFHLAGRNMPNDFYRQSTDDLINHGEVEDSLSFLASLDVLVVPLFIASGIRVKIIEAMAMGRIVITTSKGLQGIKARHRKEVLIANTASEFIQFQQILRKDKALLDTISSGAQDFARENFDQQKLTQTIIAFINHKIEDKLRLS